MSPVTKKVLYYHWHSVWTHGIFKLDLIICHYWPELPIDKAPSSTTFLYVSTRSCRLAYSKSKKNRPNNSKKKGRRLKASRRRDPYLLQLSNQTPRPPPHSSRPRSLIQKMKCPSKIVPYHKNIHNTNSSDARVYSARWCPNRASRCALRTSCANWVAEESLLSKRGAGRC